MRRRPAKLPLGMIEAMAALYRGTPLTDDERARFKQQIADRKARDERKRTAQPDLLDGGQ